MNPKKYYVTSKDIRIETPVQLEKTGYWLEYNPNIQMWRANRKGNLPMDIMGYSPHRRAVIRSVLKQS